jgi:hypothetical protein
LYGVCGGAYSENEPHRDVGRSLLKNRREQGKIFG